ncbi:hypothetical protein [Latilactobacillus curvatus]|uniref:hypothetical protein n=1 Tax=Latilactobacillus curvatus TaxID=28038 RepID=UPI0020A35B5B|nr:hypothetical protein [Latilactobacillus curvatus]UTC12523.1 hypothetical protein A4W75_05375 [Latilactobacillus curvatus]
MNKYKIDSDEHAQGWLDAFCDYIDVEPAYKCGEVIETDEDLADLAIQFNHLVAYRPAIEIKEVGVNEEDS